MEVSPSNGTELVKQMESKSDGIVLLKVPPLLETFRLRSLKAQLCMALFYRQTYSLLIENKYHAPILTLLSEMAEMKGMLFEPIDLPGSSISEIHFIKYIAPLDDGRKRFIYINKLDDLYKRFGSKWTLINLINSKRRDLIIVTAVDDLSTVVPDLRRAIERHIQIMKNGAHFQVNYLTKAATDISHDGWQMKRKFFPKLV